MPVCEKGIKRERIECNSYLLSLMSAKTHLERANNFKGALGRERTDELNTLGLTALQNALVARHIIAAYG